MVSIMKIFCCVLLLHFMYAFLFFGILACLIPDEREKRGAKSTFLVMYKSSLCLFHNGLNNVLVLMPVVKVWRMLCGHAAKVSKLERFLSIGKGIMVSRLDISLSLYPFFSRYNMHHR